MKDFQGNEINKWDIVVYTKSNVFYVGLVTHWNINMSVLELDEHTLAHIKDKNSFCHKFSSPTWTTIKIDRNFLSDKNKKYFDEIIEYLNYKSGN